MTAINVSKDAQSLVDLLAQLTKLGFRLAKNRNFLEDVRGDINAEDKKIIDDETSQILGMFIPAMNSAYELLFQFEEEFGGGWIDLGPSKALRLLGEGDITEYNLTTFLGGFKKLVQKIILLDSHQTGQQALDQTQQVLSKFSGSNKEAA